MTTVYIDVLFFVNLIVNMMLYASSCLIRRKKMIGWRIVCAAIIGAVYSCAVFFSGISPLIYNVIAIGLYMLCTWLVMGYVNVREYIKDAAATIFCALIFAGIFFLIYRYADIGSIVVFNNNVLYIDIPVFALLCVSGICFGVISLASHAFMRVIGTGTEYAVNVIWEGKTLCIRAKVDTGNSMTDPISGFPIILAEYNRIKHILPAQFTAFMCSGDVTDMELRYQRRLRMVLCKTATGSGLLPAFRPDGIQLKYNGKNIMLHNLIIAVSKSDLGEYGLLLSPAIFKEADDHDEVA